MIYLTTEFEAVKQRGLGRSNTNQYSLACLYLVHFSKARDITELVGQLPQFHGIDAMINLANTSRVKGTKLIMADVALARKTIHDAPLFMTAMLEPLILTIDFIGSTGPICNGR